MTNPPHNIAAEQAVLGAMLINRAAIPAAIAILGDAPTVFISSAHQLIYGAILSLHARAIPVDEITLLQDLADDGWSDEVGGAGYIAQLTGAVPTSANVEHYARIVVQQATLRNVITEATRLADDAAHCNGDAAEFLAAGRARLERAFEGVHNPHVLPAAINQWDAMQPLQDLAPAIIQGVLRQGHKLMLAGPSASYKSFALLQLAAAVSFGGHWLGFPCVQGRVLYVNLEIDRASYDHRVHAIREKMNTDLHAWDSWHLRGQYINADTLIPQIITQSRHRPYTLIIIDPIYTIIEGAENEAAVMVKLMRHFDHLIAKTGSSLAYVHHFAKGAAGAKETIDRAAGSGVLDRSPDSRLYLSPVEGGGFLLEMILRDFPPQPAHGMRFNYPLHILDPMLDNARVKGARGPAATCTPTDIANLLDTPQSLKNIALQLGCCERTVRRTVQNNPNLFRNTGGKISIYDDENTY